MPGDSLPTTVVASVAAVEESNSAENATENATENAFDTSATVVGGAFAAAALATWVGRDWEERVDEALADTGSHSLSKAARFVRRLRRPAARRTTVSLNRRYGGGPGH